MQFGQMKQKSLLIAGALFCALAWGAPGQAADGKNQYKIEGVGVLTCQQYLEARKKQSPIYFRMGGWLNGYLTATQRFLPKTYALAAWQSTDLLLASIAAKCTENDKLQFHNVAQLLIGFMHADRLQVNSPLIRVTRGDKKLSVFKSVMVRVQNRLSEGGFYGGEANGEYTKEIAEALMSYQGSKSLPTTGLPDQPTLGSLLGKKGATNN
ncbi:MAG: peptidoglycan-binding protein [Alphaproteobacteria bacterium]|nr:peptidoglycan-binding protein [Alphaproteobacteria bacterium]